MNELINKGASRQTTKQTKKPDEKSMNCSTIEERRNEPTNKRMNKGTNKRMIEAMSSIKQLSIMNKQLNE